MKQDFDLFAILRTDNETVRTYSIIHTVMPLKHVLRPIPLIRRFLRERGGSVMAVTGLMLPIIGGAGLFSLDHMRASQQIAAMQKAADAAALTSVRQLAFVLSGTGNDTAARNRTLTDIASGLVHSTLDRSLPDATTTAELVTEGLVRVSLTARYGSLFGEMGAFGDNPFTVTSSAQTFGGQDICIIALGSKDEEPGIDMKDSAQLKSGTCEIYSNSDLAESISVEGSARIEAQLICSSGGYKGSGSNFSTTPATDCARIDDPLKERAPPITSSSCDYEDDIEYKDGGHTMMPGTYCGKVEISGNAQVTMNPGIYIFMNDQLYVGDDASLTGKGVGLYFVGQDATFRFSDDAYIELDAPVTGAMAGILVSALPLCFNNGARVSASASGGAKVCDSGREFSIESAYVESLLGTIHLPTDTLRVKTTMPVSEAAAFTIVVVGRLMLEDSPTLTLNTDYDATDVPVPAGFRDGNKTPPRLIR